MGVLCMVIFIEKRQLLAVALAVSVLGGMAAVLWAGHSHLLAVSGTAELAQRTVYIVDPGHGGEDGGAVAGDGTVESGVNLAIALRLNDLLRFCGQNTRLTRQEDVSIYSEGAKTLREKKVSDLKNRVAMVNGQPGSILVSIHQNKLPEAPRVHGAQVFYNTVDGADALAQQVQSVLNQTVNAGNAKESKQISSTIYLMKNVTAPAVLVECGFLSNPDETAALQRPEYQLKLAVAITGGLLESAGESGNAPGGITEEDASAMEGT